MLLNFLSLCNSFTMMLQFSFRIRSTLSKEIVLSCHLSVDNEGEIIHNEWDKEMTVVPFWWRETSLFRLFHIRFTDVPQDFLMVTVFKARKWIYSNWIWNSILKLPPEIRKTKAVRIFLLISFFWSFYFLSYDSLFDSLFIILFIFYQTLIDREG